MWVILGGLSLKSRAQARHAISIAVQAFYLFRRARSTQILERSCNDWT